jgi:hypothetical protein
MDNLIIPATDFTPAVNFQIESGQLELSGISRPENVAGFYQGPLEWLSEFERYIQNRPEYKYEIPELRFSFKMTYFNSGSSKYIIQILRILRNLIRMGVNVKIDWYFEEGDDKMQDNGEDFAEAVELDFNYIEV